MDQKNSQAEQDEAAKEAERKARAAARPGALSIGAEEAARLDQRIAEKRERANLASPSSGLTQLESNLKARQLATGSAFQPTTAGRTQLSAMEADVAAKTRSVAAAATRPGVQQVSLVEDPVAAKVRRETAAPGAVAAGGSLEDKAAAKIRRDASQGGAGRTELNQMEDAVAAKVRRETSQALAPLSNLEDAVAAKVRRETSAAGAPTQLSNLEDAVASKVRRETSSAGAQAQLSNLEDSVASKVRRETSSAAARSELDSLESAVSSKVRGEATARNQLDNLEEAVSSKVRRETPLIRAELANLEETVAGKVRNEPANVRGELSGMEAEIAAKENQNNVNKNDEDLDKDKYVNLSPEQAPMFLDKEEASGPVTEAQVTTIADRGVRQPGGLEYGVYTGGNAGLAVAVAVEEEDPDKMFIPAAIEYDPDAKPPLYRNRRFRLYTFLSFFVIIVVAIGAGIGATIGSKDKDYTPAPTPAPTTFREGLGIRAQIERVVGQELLEDPDSPYSRAMDWITYDDPMQLSPQDPNFVQRYTAAYFYFATTVDGPWRSCNPPEDPWSAETFCWFSSLSAIFPLRFTDYPSNAWLSNITECEWAGVTCDEQHQIRNLDFRKSLRLILCAFLVVHSPNCVLPTEGNQLSGPFPEGIYNFAFLQMIAFTWSDLRGPLPAAIVDMKHLVSIELHYNMFTGAVPDEWWSARNLQRINIGENMISGPISKGVSTLRDLKGLFLFTNLMTGEIPDEITDLDSLTYLRLARNQFHGRIPERVDKLLNIKEIWLHRNQLTGTIPRTIGNVTSLDELRIQVNPLHGEIPDEIYSIPHLQRIDLYECDFSGTISPEIGQLGDQLYYFRISDNHFSGQIPAEFANLTFLYAVWLSGNDFTGSIPAGVCAHQGDELKEVLVEFTADCTENATGIAELACECCSTCCKADGTDCLPTEPLQE